MKRTVLQMLDEAADRFSSLPYVYKKSDSGYVPLTFLQARELARDFAAWLIDLGLQKGGALAILAEGSPEWIVGELGILSAGCVSIPLSIRLLQEEIPFRLNHSEAKAILTTKNQLEKVLGAFKDVTDAELRLIYLDSDIATAREVAKKMGISGHRLFGFAEALELGARARKDPSKDIADKLESTLASVQEDDTVTICYTSGTTGNPKGILLTHRNYWVNCHDGVELFHMPRGLRTLIILPVDHSFAHTAGLYVAFIIGMAIYFVDSRGGGTLRNIPINLKECEPNILMTVPALSGNFMRKIISGVEEKGGLVERLFKTGIRAGIAINGDGFARQPLGLILRNILPYAIAKILIFGKIKKMVFGRNLMYCVGGGAILDVKQQEFFAAFGVPIYQGYGLTEAAPVISSNSPVVHRYGSSGQLCPSIECKFVKADGSLAAPGETGEIVIRGGNVMKGYLKNPEATDSALRDGWLYTGDLAYLDKDGFLFVVGREKALLIAEDGEKYSPEEIEEAIASGTDVIDQIMAWCDQKKYVVSLVTLDRPKVERIIYSQGITEAITLLALLKNEFDRFRSNPKAKKVQQAWLPAVFQIVGRGFSDKDGTVNSTAKIVRHRIASVHRDLIDYSYTPEGGRTTNDRNLAELRSLFGLK